MLFTSYQFLLVFLPATLLVALFVRGRASLRLLALALASLIFYACWDVRFLVLLLGSVAVNYALGLAIQRAVVAGQDRRASGLAILGTALNLLVLGWFKYLGFVLENVDALFGAGLVVPRWILPLGISFYTFEQIGFLIDLRRGASFRLDPWRFLVFVSFFPRLVAGPILRYEEIAPQLERPAQEPYTRQLAVGLSILAIGLAKKAFLADGIAPHVPGPFDAAAAGHPVDLLTAWGGALAYTCQLYFDFSGYSDMAIGAAWCLGVRLPENFDSPYKSASIIEFWRRWHITLSRFLRDYLYIGLGGNRRGPVRRYANLLATMLIGGLWHGANWTFVVWGGLHGSFLVVNHAWNALTGRKQGASSVIGQLAGVVLTFGAVVAGWVVFRADTLTAAVGMLRGMTGVNGVELPAAITWRLGSWPARLGIGTGGSGTEFVGTWLWVAALLALAFLAPNRRAIVSRVEGALGAGPGNWSSWRMRGWAVAVGTLAFLGFISINRASAFLYWQF